MSKLLTYIAALSLTASAIARYETRYIGPIIPPSHTIEWGSMEIPTGDITDRIREPTDQKIDDSDLLDYIGTLSSDLDSLSRMKEGIYRNPEDFVSYGKKYFEVRKMLEVIQAIVKSVEIDPVLEEKLQQQLDLFKSLEDPGTIKLYELLPGWQENRKPDN